MGGRNSQALKTYRGFQEQIPEGKETEGMSEETRKAYAPYDTTVITEPKIPNFFGRDASAVSADSVIKKNQELVKKPVSSYEAIDVGLK